MDTPESLFDEMLIDMYLMINVRLIWFLRNIDCMIHDNMTVYMTVQMNEQRKERCWLYWMCIAYDLKDCLTVFSSSWNRYVGGIVSLRYNVGDTVPLRL